MSEYFIGHYPTTQALLKPITVIYYHDFLSAKSYLLILPVTKLDKYMSIGYYSELYGTNEFGKKKKKFAAYRL